MLFVKKCTDSSVHFFGCFLQAQYSVFLREFQLWELKAVCWFEMRQVHGIVGQV
jgi:hypothetical protein